MTKEEIALILKKLRIEAGGTQKEISEKLNKKQQTIASWETGQFQPDANTLFVLCDLYGTSVESYINMNEENRNLFYSFIKAMNSPKEGE